MPLLSNAAICTTSVPDCSVSVRCASTVFTAAADPDRVSAGPLVEPITRLIINSVSCTAPAVQLAGVAALEGPRDEINAMMAEFTKRREFVVNGLNKLRHV